VRFALATDSHQPAHLSFMRYAVDLARRAGLEAGDIVNTLPLAQLRAALKRGKRTWNPTRLPRLRALQTTA
jgi:histidinol phosphatase-like PHP family hydrolase